MASEYKIEKQLYVKFIEKKFSRGKSRGTRSKFLRVERHKVVRRKRYSNEVGEYPEGN